MSSLNHPHKEEGIWDIEEIEDKVIKPNQWAAVGSKTFKAVSVTHSKLPAGCYSINRDNQDGNSIYIGKHIKSDDILTFKDGLTEKFLRNYGSLY